MASPTQTFADARPTVAIVSNSQTPYRLHLHLRIAREIPQIRLASLYTHQTSNAPWAFAAPDEIGAVQFGQGESAEFATNLRTSLREWRRGGRIIAWLRQHPTRFVVMMGYNDAGRVRLIRWCRKNGVPCWLFGDSNIRGDRAAGAKAAVKRIIVGKILAWCNGVFSCGQLGKEYFAKYGADTSRCFYFPYEPDYDLIQSLSPAAIEQTRQRFSLSPDRRRIVFSGRLTDVKRPDLLIDAFAKIAAARPQWDLLMIGGGPLRESLESRLPPDLRPRVQWTGFLDDQAAVSALYKLCDVLVLPSDYEPWALVINEAAAAGLAIISSNVVGAAKELVRDGVNGRVFPPGDAAALTASLLAVTDPGTIDSTKAASGAILADWRSRGDPVQGLRNALQLCGVIPES